MSQAVIGLLVRLLNHMQESEYSIVLASDSKDNAIATGLAAAGTADQRYYISGFDASYSAATTAFESIQILDGTTVIYIQYFNTAIRHNFIQPIRCSLASSLSIIIGASGTAGVIGKVDIRGYLK